MARRILCAVFAAVLLAVGMVSASAAADVGVIRVATGEDGAMTLYQVGEFINGGFRLGDAYGGGAVTDMDSLSAELAAWLAQKAEGGTIARAENRVCVFSDLSEGLYLAVQTEASAGYYEFQPFLISVPWDGNTWEIDAKPKMQEIPTETPKTGEGAELAYALVCMTVSLLGLVALMMGGKADFEKGY